MKQINLQENLRKKFLKKGVKMIAPETVFFSKDTKIGKNVIIDPYVVIKDKVKIQNNVKIFSFSHLENVKIENNVNIGPYARIRPGTILKSGSRVGNFVEIKKSKIGKKSKVNHLSYIGDSYLGKNVNIGAGTITCNYDGLKKNKTNIKDKVFIGSNSSLVAPVTINKNSVVGAGSVITKNVKNNDSPIKSWLGGICCVPIAIRKKDSTTTIRVNDVIIIRIEGANERIVSRKIICSDTAASPPLADSSTCRLILGILGKDCEVDSCGAIVNDKIAYIANGKTLLPWPYRAFISHHPTLDLKHF